MKINEWISLVGYKTSYRDVGQYRVLQYIHHTGAFSAKLSFNTETSEVFDARIADNITGKMYYYCKGVFTEHNNNNGFQQVTSDEYRSILHKLLHPTFVDFDIDLEESTITALKAKAIADNVSVDELVNQILIDVLVSKSNPTQE